MVNKKGYIKTLEAVIAIILIIVVSYTLISQHVETPPEPPLIVQGAMRFINEKIEFDEYIRERIIPYDGSTATWTPSEENPFSRITSFVTESAPRAYDFGCTICSTTNLCFINTPLERSVYTSDVFIASGGKKQDPKLIRIWFWKQLTGDERTLFETQNPLYYNTCFDCVGLNKNGKTCTES